MMRQLVSFRLNLQLVGMDILYVREINRELDSTEVQLADDHIIGLSNLRGQIVTLFDLARRLGLEGNLQPTERHDIVLKSEAELAPIRARLGRSDLIGSRDVVGLRVDSIAEIIELEDAQLQPVPANLTHLNQQYLASVAPLAQELLLVLDVPQLVSTK